MNIRQAIENPSKRVYWVWDLATESVSNARERIEAYTAHQAASKWKEKMWGCGYQVAKTTLIVRDAKTQHEAMFEVVSELVHIAHRKCK